jgi:hypothetical protein
MHSWTPLVLVSFLQEILFCKVILHYIFPVCVHMLVVNNSVLTF